MDIRGIEVTNQLRSAIRAKLLELGVRYDEELPDYILVMVVNKKSRQQMHEDLHLFLEDSTTPFVEWLHDQVLKKLQKVTVAKKKTTREFVPTVVVKQEEERRKRKSSATTFLDDQVINPNGEKPQDKLIKEDKISEKSTTKSSTSDQSSEENQGKNTEKSIKNTNASDSRLETTLVVTNRDIDKSISIKKAPNQTNEPKNSLNNTVSISTDTQISSKAVNVFSKFAKKDTNVLDKNNHTEKTLKAASSKNSDDNEKLSDEEEEDIDDNGGKKLKSSVNKPRITSVVSVKNRLGIVSPRKKFEVHRDRMGFDTRYRQSEKRVNNRRNNFSRQRTFDNDDVFRRNREFESRDRDSDKVNDVKNRLGISKEEKSSKTIESKDKTSTLKLKFTEKSAVTVKDRLGVATNNKVQRDPTAKSKETVESQRISNVMTNKNIKNRLGPVKNNFKALDIRRVHRAKTSQSSEDDDCLNIGGEDELDDDAQSVINVGPLKSHIIAVKRTMPDRTERKRLKLPEKFDKDISSDVEDDSNDDGKIASKVIVTPRPLRPLPPAQKRATQSLLLRAVAEANQSVVKQKNPEPVLSDKKPLVKPLKPASSREVDQNLLVHLNASKRLVMRKIRVDISNKNCFQNQHKSHLAQADADEQKGVLMSLFQRNDDNQQFLVTLNGYNNNISKQKNLSDDEERLEMEVNEGDEFTLDTIQTDMYVQSESCSNTLPLTDIEEDLDISEDKGTEENNENCNIENVEGTEDVPRKRRKLSPIVFNRSRSPSPAKTKPATVAVPAAIKNVRPSVDATLPETVEKSREKCRYWPNCTLGSKCAFSHPAVPCSAFPACKFGDKCAYKHPKCKFGLSCTKLGCVFSHPTQQCKYHPYCTKPACPYSHPPAVTTLPIEATSQRAKFTWRRRD
ncbi:zinc finger CCCH domain-containing protein 14 [Cephus cinctus]|uniref:Zinc finger CCCH domain-containing protein 14 n=1 Tax=Cephus cinctus TaxID=211228 RepID=A0AAJ7BJW4_CEPCN|nr:zinc finger CCCH domain-containing protein 14 [Cephus cinctus]